MRTTGVLLLVSLVAGVGCSQTSQPAATVANEDVIAIVLGRTLTVNDKDELSGLILGSLLERFAKDNNIEPTTEELDAFILKSEEKVKQHQIRMEEERLKLMQELKNSSLSDQEREQTQSHLQTIESILETIRAMNEQAKEMEEQTSSVERQVARQFVQAWKINKALYDKYGGRVIFQQAGIEPLDAYREFLKEQEKEGSFEILDRQYEAGFWRYFTDDAMHTFYPEDDGAEFINTPWWMMEEPPE